MIMPLTTGLPSLLPTLDMFPAAGPVRQARPAPAESPAFADVLQDLAASAASTLRTGEAAALAGIQGQIPLQTMVDRVLAAERSLQAAIAVRDKVVGSFLEISRMQI